MRSLLLLPRPRVRRPTATRDSRHTGDRDRYYYYMFLYSRPLGLAQRNTQPLPGIPLTYTAVGGLSAR